LLDVALLPLPADRQTVDGIHVEQKDAAGPQGRKHILKDLAQFICG
jgi:hypothetical protein